MYVYSYVQRTVTTCTVDAFLCFLYNIFYYWYSFMGRVLHNEYSLGKTPEAAV